MNIHRKDASISNTGPDESMPGSFQVILSAPTLDRDGDVLRPEEWKQPLPEHITFDVDHGMSVMSTVGSGTPHIDPTTGNLIVNGTYSSLPRAQEVRTLVNEGHIRTTSVAFMSEPSTTKDGKPSVSRELLNGAFVAIPSNREALVLASKAALKAGARNSASDQALIQSAHDSLVQLGADCGPMDASGAAEGSVSGAAFTGAAKKASFEPLKAGTNVSWDYRGTEGHGEIVGVHKLGTTHDNTEYSIREHDHHVSASGSHEPSIVYHYGSDIHVESGKSLKGAVPSDLPLFNDRSRAYTADDVLPRLQKWASSDHSGDKDKIDWAKYRQAFLWYDDSAPDTLGAYKLPVGDEVNGKLYAIWRSVAQIAGIIQGSRGGTTIPSGDVAGVKADLERYYHEAAAMFKDPKIKPPWSDKSLKAATGGVAADAQGVDGVIDEICSLIDGQDISTLPEWAAQALSLAAAAHAAVDDLLDEMNVFDPDDDDDDQQLAARAIEFELAQFL